MNQFSDLIIVSTGRTGTQFLASFFGELGADAHHEPGPFWLRNASNAYVSGHLSDDRAIDLLRRTRAGDLKAGERPYVESSCLVYGLSRPLLDGFPDVRVVHVVRDPRTYVRSAMNWGVYRPGGRPLNAMPYRRLAPPQYSPLAVDERVRWMGKNQFERVCWAWTTMNRAMRLQGEGADRFATVRFEDIFDADASYPGLRQIAEFVGYELSASEVERFGSTKINANRARSFPKYDGWSDRQKETLVDVCGEEAGVYGYELTSGSG